MANIVRGFLSRENLDDDESLAVLLMNRQVRLRNRFHLRLDYIKMRFNRARLACSLCVRFQSFRVVISRDFKGVGSHREKVG